MEFASFKHALQELPLELLENMVAHPEEAWLHGPEAVRQWARLDGTKG